MTEHRASPTDWESFGDASADSSRRWSARFHHPHDASLDASMEAFMAYDGHADERDWLLGV